VAERNASPETIARVCGPDTRPRISNLFTDIVLPRTVAREIEAEMAEIDWHSRSSVEVAPHYIEIEVGDVGGTVPVLCNRYVQFLLERPDIREKYAITPREMEVLSFLDQPPAPGHPRSEGGRYRGALFATAADIAYLESQGIQRRNIHEIDSIGQNWKFVKEAGTPTLEFFPGLVFEALLGILRIALERAAMPATARPRTASDSPTVAHEPAQG
jgi:hypothetical protein